MADVFTKPLEPLQFINLVNKINSPPPKISINHISPLVKFIVRTALLLVEDPTQNNLEEQLPQLVDIADNSKQETCSSKTNTDRKFV